MIEASIKSVQCISPAGLHTMSYKEWGASDNPNVLVCAHGVTRVADDFDNLARAMCLHKIIQAVTDADSLHLLMRANITPGSLIYFPLFHVDNFAQGLQAPAAVAAAGKLYAVCLFGLLQFIPALQPCGFVCLTGLKGFL